MRTVKTDSEQNMRSKLLLIIVFFAAIYSCKKDALQHNALPMYTDANLSFLQTAVSDSCSENDFYIKGEFNGRKLCFATVGQSGSSFTDTFMNAYYVYHYEKIKKDSTTNNLYLIRYNADKSLTLALYCGQTHIQSRSFPYTQPHPNLEQCEFSELQLINNNKAYSSGQNPAYANYTFMAHTGFGVTLTFTDCSKDNIVQGNFEGILKSNGGSAV